MPLRLLLWTGMLLLGACCLLQTADSVRAASALSPRRSGLEAPGGPRPLQGMPAQGMNRTPQGGMGYTDAYGNSLDDIQPEEKKPRKRVHPGAYGGYGPKVETRPLPDPQAGSSGPVWSFN